MNEKEQIPFPDRLITWYDLAKGVGEVVLHAMFDLVRHEPKPTESEHYDHYEPLRKDLGL